MARSSTNSSSCLLVSRLSTQATLPTPAAAEVNAVTPLLRKVGTLLYEEGEPAMTRYLDNIISLVKNGALMASTKTKMRMSGTTPDAILRGDKDGRLLSFLQQTTSKHAEVLDSLANVQKEMLRQDHVKESGQQLLSLQWAAKLQSLQQDQLFGDLATCRVDEFSAKDELATGMVRDCRATQTNPTTGAKTLPAMLRGTLSSCWPVKRCFCSIPARASFQTCSCRCLNSAWM